MSDEDSKTGSRMHHVNLGVPTGGVPAEVEFLTNIVGLTEATEKKARATAMLARNNPPIVVPPETVLWYEDGEGFEVHLTEDPNHHPAEKAHVAFVVGEGLQDIEAELGSRGVATTELLNVPELRVLATTDPAGNVWEFRGHNKERG
jgi:catechol 2,3-dioxygenase-like lactoylglutathione lyase family enzyme